LLETTLRAVRPTVKSLTSSPANGDIVLQLSLHHIFLLPIHTL
jgi:hypothetical protein